MSYLIHNDYNRLIQDVTLQQIISGNLSLVKLTEQAALSEMISYLVQKYDIQKEFTDTLKYNPATIYKANDRVYLDGPVYDPTKTYANNSIVVQPTQQVSQDTFAYPGPINAIAARNDIWIIAGQTPNFVTGATGYHNSSLIGWNFTIEQKGAGTLTPGIDINYTSDGFDFINGYTVQGNERFDIKFQSKVVANSSIGSTSSFNGVYKANTIISSPEAFNPDHWTLLGSQYDMFYATEPAAEFNLQSQYPKGYVVFYKNHTYTALLPTKVYTHDEVIQFANTNNLPYQNIFPDDLNEGSTYWHDEGVYTVPVGSITDLTKWTPGDNRNQQLVEYMMDIVVYKLYKRISPKDIPTGRVDAYSVALGWLKQAAKGTDITADIPKVIPASGKRIRWGSNIKNVNSY